NQRVLRVEVEEYLAAGANYWVVVMDCGELPVPGRKRVDRDRLGRRWARPGRRGVWNIRQIGSGWQSGWRWGRGVGGWIGSLGLNGSRLNDEVCAGVDQRIGMGNKADGSDCLGQRRTDTRQSSR